MARQGVPNAEIVRRLQPFTREVGLPVPSYSTVRRIADAERRLVAGPRPDRDRALQEVLAGRMPRVYGTS
jgi:hypothetical protein